MDFGERTVAANAELQEFPFRMKLF